MKGNSNVEHELHINVAVAATIQFERFRHGFGEMCRMIELTATKFKGIIDAEKCTVRNVIEKVARTVRYSVCILRIVLFLHSAKDLSSVLRLYGVEDSSEIG